ncbi:hypothetical protein AB0P21_19710 [Kribbella sp. NPDC056861]|uniref:DISARM anti-phage system protein DrmE domain-containing protein n=1 Tax=Kribbella sp. NPDC056861 TaxID=3154857 RepID=UPI003429648F
MVGMADAVLREDLRTRSPDGAVVSYLPTLLDLELLRMADAAIATGVPLGIVFPLHAPDAALMLATTSVVGAVLQHRGLDVQVAVAAKHVANPSYDRLHLRDLRIADFVSRARVLADGTVKVVRESAAGKGRLYLTGELDRLAALLPSLDAVVADQSGTTPDGLAALLGQKPAALYLTRSPLDPNLDLLRRQGGAVWGMDSSLPNGSDRPSPMASAQLLAASASAPITITAPEQSGPYDHSLTSLWRALGALLGASSETSQLSSLGRRADAGAIRWAWSMFHVAAALPIDSSRYDEVARANPYLPTSRLGEAAAVALEFARAATAGRREAWYEVARAFDDLVRQPSVKQSALIGWVAERVSAGQQGAVVARGETMAGAIRTALAESPEVPDGCGQFVRVITFAQLPAVAAQTPLELCLTGAVPRWAAGLLAAPPGAGLTVIAGGPEEAARVRRAVISAREALQEIRRETVTVTATRLGVEPLIEFRPTEPEVGLTRYDVPLDAMDNNPWEPFSGDVDQLVIGLLGEVTERPHLAGGESAQGVADAIAVHLENDTVILLAPNSLVTRRRRERLANVAAKSIAAGDILLLVDREARADLLGSVLARLAETTAYSTLLLLITFWHERIGLARGGDRTYADILDRMAGTAITSDSTIGTWIRGEVGGPADKADIERVATAIGDDVLAAQATQVGWALTTLHRVHRKLGRWLAAQLDGAKTTPGDATVDAALGVHVADLLDAVTSWRVVEVEADRYEVGPALLGSILSRTDLDDPLVRRRSG